MIRLHSLLKMANTTDSSFDNAPAATISIVEINVAIVCACLPTLKPLIAPWIGGLSRSRGSHGSSRGTASHRRGQSSGMPTIGGYSMGLNSLSTKRGTERLDGESGDHDKIRVVTSVDVKVHGRDVGQEQGSSKSSTESLFRSATHIV